MKKRLMNRRQALSLIGGCGVLSTVRNPVDILIHGLVDGIINKAQAEQGRVGPRNYIYFYLGGGPNRWVFDLPLTPYSAATDIVKHPQVNTRFDANLLPTYATVPITRNGATINMPWLWSTTIPTVGGGSVPMGDLLSNMLILRGVNMTLDGHDTNGTKQLRPVSNAPSLDGAVADGATTPIPTVTSTANYYAEYKSNRGIGQSNADFTKPNPLGAVLSPFNRTGDQSATYLSRREAMSSAVNRALNSLSTYSNSGNPGAEGLYDMRHRAEDLLKRGIGDVAAEFTTLRNKYLGLIRSVAASSISGVSDRPIPYSANMGGSALSTRMSDREITRNADLRTLVHSTALPNYLIDSCAIAEYLICRGYSSSVSTGVAGISGVYYENVLNIDTMAVVASALTGWTFDEHFYGSYVTLIVDSFLYRAIAACLYELIQALKSKNLFQETVIHIASEFGRIPRDDQSGADHGWSANTTSLISGAIQKPMVLGNILRDATKGAQSRMGAWGSSADVKVAGQERNLHYGHTSATVAQLLRVERPMPNYTSLVTENANGEVSPTIDLATNKGGG